MKIKTKRMTRRVTAVLTAFVMILGGLVMPPGSAKAGSGIDLSSCIVMSGTTDAAVAEGANPSASVLLNLPDSMNDRAELAALGVQSMSVTLRTSDYTAYEGETAGALAFLQNGTDYSWYDGDSWTALTSDEDITLTLDIANADWGSGSSVGKIGIQFTNLAAGSTVDYEISSIGFVTSGGGTVPEVPSGGTQDYEYEDIDYNYARLLQYSLYFYDANMCGSGVSENSLLSWRENCHTFDTYTYKRSDGSSVDVNLAGGFHDAGDHVKFGLPEAYAAFVLGMSYDTDKEAYAAAKQTGHLKKITTYFADYFVSATVLSADGTRAEAFCYQVGQGGAGFDHAYWGSPEAQTNANRPIVFTDASQPATDIVSLSAAALAMQYKNFGGDKYLDTAEKLFEYARTNKKSVAAYGSDYYYSSGWEDDYCLAALLLYQITGEQKYMTEFNTYSSSSNAQKGYWPLGWDNVGPAVAYYNGNRTSLANIMNLSDGNSSHGGYRCLSDWGSARYNTSMQYTGLLYDRMTGSTVYQSFAEDQMQYLLGNNEAKQCYVVGYNAYASKYPHHRAASGYTGGDQGTRAQAHVLLGALVGGQKLDGSYTDSASDYICNEVALDYNATLVAAAAALYNINRSDTEHQYIDNSYYSDGGDVNPEEPSTEELTTEEPSTEEPTTEEPTTEKPGTEEPSTGEPTTEEPGGEDPKPDVPDKKVTAITLSQTERTLSIGATFKLTAQVQPADADNSELAWTSQYEDIATVDANGRVTAHAAGTTRIFANAKDGSGQYAVCTVTVTAAATQISLTGSNTDIRLSNTSYTYSGTARKPEPSVTYNGSKVLEKGVDYTVAYQNNVNAGTATCVITGTGSYKGSVSVSFTIAARGITSGVSASMGDEVIVYDGKVKQPIPILTYNDKNLVNGKDFTLSYQDNTEIGNATVVVKGKGNFKGTMTLSFVIKPGRPSIETLSNASTGIKITWKTIPGAKGYYIYRKDDSTGVYKQIAKVASPTAVSYIDTTAVNGINYAYRVQAYKSSFRSQQSKGKQKLCVAAPKLTQYKNVATNRISLIWSENSLATGYEVQYSTNSDMSKPVTLQIKNPKTISKAISGLTRGKTYYVRVRAYKTVNGRTTSSGWSGKKTVMVKR